MADFCKQCSIKLWGEDSRDLANLGGGRELSPGYGWACICEGCGGTVVDNDGVCVSPHCMRKHGVKDEKGAT